MVMQRCGLLDKASRLDDGTTGMTAPPLRVEGALDLFPPLRIMLSRHRFALPSKHNPTTPLPAGYPARVRLRVGFFFCLSWPPQNLCSK
jgi:hypothetical protein